MKFGFTARLTLIIVLGFSCLATSMAAIRYVQRGWATSDLPRMPLPDQLASMVTLLEKASPKDRLLLLRSFNTPRSQVYIAKESLKANGRVRMMRTEKIFERFFKIEDYRNIRVYVRDTEKKTIAKAHLFVASDFSLSVRLKTNEYLVINKHDNLNASIFGVPPGFWAGIIGFFVTTIVMIAVLREIGPLKRLAEHLQNFSHRVTPVKVEEKGAAEVRLVISAFNEMQERINDLMQGRSLMLSAIAHDFRTYLTRFRLRLEKVEEPVRKKLIADIDDMSTLIEKSLELTRIEREEIDRQSVDLPALIEDECAKAENDLHRITRVGLSQISALIFADELSIRRIISNILENAIKYGEHASVTLEPDASHISIHIDDDGPGIPEVERKSVLEPFRRLETSRNRSTGGVGLGLAIANELSAQNDGELIISSSPSGGARVTIRFPLLSA